MSLVQIRTPMMHFFKTDHLIQYQNCFMEWKILFKNSLRTMYIQYTEGVQLVLDLYQSQFGRYTSRNDGLMYLVRYHRKYYYVRTLKMCYGCQDRCSFHFPGSESPCESGYICSFSLHIQKFINSKFFHVRLLLKLLYTVYCLFKHSIYRGSKFP